MLLILPGFCLETHVAKSCYIATKCNGQYTFVQLQLCKLCTLMLYVVTDAPENMEYGAFASNILYQFKMFVIMIPNTVYQDISSNSR